jgi:septal ring factor EnvC (AmiA/AmiB activator)
MRSRSSFLLFLLLALNDVSPAFAANGQAQEGGSLIVWILIFLPALVFMLLAFLALRAGRKQQAIVQTEVQRSEDERGRAAEHRDRLEAQMDRLDEKLARMIELLSAIERGQRIRGL